MLINSIIFGRKAWIKQKKVCLSTAFQKKLDFTEKSEIIKFEINRVLGYKYLLKIYINIAKGRFIDVIPYL